MAGTQIYDDNSILLVNNVEGNANSKFLRDSLKMMISKQNLESFAQELNLDMHEKQILIMEQTKVFMHQPVAIKKPAVNDSKKEKENTDEAEEQIIQGVYSSKNKNELDISNIGLDIKDFEIGDL